MEDIVRADHGDPPEQEPDPASVDGLHHPLDYVLMTWQEKRNGFLPEPGGLNDQDAALVYHDWPLVSRLYNEAAHRLYPPDEDGTHPAPKARGVPVPDDAPDFRTIRSMMEGS